MHLTFISLSYKASFIRVATEDLGTHSYIQKGASECVNYMNFLSDFLSGKESSCLVIASLLPQPGEGPYCKKHVPWSQQLITGILPSKVGGYIISFPSPQSFLWSVMLLFCFACQLGFCSYSLLKALQCICSPCRNCTTQKHHFIITSLNS